MNWLASDREGKSEGAREQRKDMSCFEKLEDGDSSHLTVPSTTVISRDSPHAALQVSCVLLLAWPLSYRTLLSMDISMVLTQCKPRIPFSWPRLSCFADSGSRKSWDQQSS